MTHGHFERLTAVDAAALSVETPNLPMHVAGLFVFDPPGGGAPAFSFARFVDLVGSRLHLVPRYRQRLASPPLGIHHPVWVDDPEFDLAYHLRHAALPGPGTTHQLMEYGARVLSRPLDRSRPLWELYVIEGLEHGRTAVLAKSHQAIVDDRSGFALSSVLLDLDHDASLDVPPPQPWEPRPVPSSLELGTAAVKDLAASPAHVVASGRRAVARPARAVRRVLKAGRGAAMVARANLVRPAPRSLLNATPGRGRRLAIQRVELNRVRQIKDACNTTVNDVVLAMVADATGRYLRHRGVRTDGLWLRALVPVATRAARDRHVLGNRVVSTFVDLPVFEMDPAERLAVCADAMREVKSSHQAVGADFLIGLHRFAPPTLHAMAARLAVRGRLYNFLITNVPGPQEPVWCLGARLLGAFPFTPLAPSQCFAVGVTSIDGWLNFGFVADYDVVPDLDAVPDMLLAGLEELSRCAEAVEARRETVMPSAGRRTASDDT